MKIAANAIKKNLLLKEYEVIILPYTEKYDLLPSNHNFIKQTLGIDCEFAILIIEENRVICFSHHIELQLLKAKKSIINEYYDISNTKKLMSVVHHYISKNKSIAMISNYIGYQRFKKLFEVVKDKINIVSIDIGGMHCPVKNNQKLIKMKYQENNETINSFKKRYVSKINTYVFLQSFESISWLLDTRSVDQSECSVLLKAYLIYNNSEDKFYLFTFDNIEIQKFYQNDKYINILHISEYNSFIEMIKNDKHSIIVFDYNEVSLDLFDKCKKYKIKTRNKKNTISKKKSIKSANEIRSFIKIHQEDSVKIIEFLCWLSKYGENGSLTEELCAKKIEQLRSENSKYLCPSFHTISAFNENGAIIHYNYRDNKKKIDKRGLYLIDSGGHYIGGTTDITRTVAIGIPTEKQKFHYTLVLKGLIAFRKHIFNIKTKPKKIDLLARQFLKKYKLNYQHSTSHGIGNCLSVHEMPPSINTDNTFKNQMVISVEPGIYIENEYGIRIEDNVYIKKINKDYYGFEILNFVPYDKNLINFKMITSQEYKFLSKYNQLIVKKTKGMLSEEAQIWLSNTIFI